MIESAEQEGADNSSDASVDEETHRPRLVESAPEAAEADAPDPSGESWVGDAKAFEDPLGPVENAPAAEQEETAEDSGGLLTMDAELAHETAKWSEQRSRFQKLIASAEQGREKVKPEIFSKVLHDYEVRLAEAEEAYSPLRSRVLDHVRKVMEEERRVRERLEEINDVVEELRFRLQLGEFEEDEFETRRQESTGELTDLDERLGQIEALYRNVRELLGSEASEVLEERGAPQEVTQPPSASEAAGTALPLPSPSPTAEGRTVIVATGERLLAKVDGQVEATLKLTPLTPGLGDALDVADRQILVGRSTSCDIVLKGATVSRRHAMVRRADGRAVVEDISSGGGVLVNGQRITGSSPLAAGDVIQIGNASLRVDPVD